MSPPRVRCAERSTIANVIEACLKEEKSGLLAPLAQACVRASLYTKKSHRSIVRIKKETSRHPRVLSQAKRRNAKPKKRPGNFIEIDSFDRSVIRRTIEEFYLDMKVAPSLRKLLPAIRAKINFPWGKGTLQRVLKEMGFTWKETCSKHAVLTELCDNVDKRYRYLVRMKHLREDNRAILFTDETCVDSNLTFRKCWETVENVCERYTNVIIGSTDGFLPGGKLVFKVGTNSGAEGQTNTAKCPQWAEQVLPTLPPRSVIVMAAPFHAVQVNEPPCRSASKPAMLSWLRSNGIHVDESMRKSALYEIITAKKPKSVIYRIDQLFESHGHTVVRLPPYNCDLSPVELVWAKLKKYVQTHYVAEVMDMPKLGALLVEGLNTVTSEDWREYCHHVQQLELLYWDKDAMIEEAIDSMVNAGGVGNDESENEHLSENSDSPTDDLVE